MKEAEKAIQQDDLRHIRVLLVDDCPDQQRLYLKFLLDSGCSVHLECNGQAALEALRADPSGFHAIVLDFLMPNMDGVETTFAARSLGFQGAILGFTATGDAKLENRWREAGCDGYLEKPVGRNELVSSLLECVQLRTGESLKL